MTIHRAVIVLAVALGFAGCAAPQEAESAPSPATSTGGESAPVADTVDGDEAGGAYPLDADSEAEPSVAREDAETLDAVTAFDALRSVEHDYDALLDSGSSDCPEAERLVQRICYLAERVCGLEGVDAQPDEDDEGAARCDESRARCARSEARLARTCP